MPSRHEANAINEAKRLQLLRQVPREKRRRILLLQRLNVLEKSNMQSRTAMCASANKCMEKLELSPRNKSTSKVCQVIKTALVISKTSTNLRNLCSQLYNRKSVSVSGLHYIKSTPNHVRNLVNFADCLIHFVCRSKLQVGWPPPMKPS